MTFSRLEGWGFGVPPQGWENREHLLPAALGLLQPDWWYNWSPFAFLPDAYPGYVPMLWGGREAIPPTPTASLKAHEDYNQLRATIAARPEYVWQFLNEPDRQDQANISPKDAFEGLKAFVRLAWDVGVEGQYGAPGIEMSVRGLRWGEEFMKLCRRHFLHRPAVVTVHCYLNGLPQTRENWDAMWGRFWAWHAFWAPGVRVAVTEVCALNHPESKQRDIMDMAREALDHPLVDGVAWYSANTWPGDPFPNGALSTYDPATESVSLTPLGEYWLSLRD